MPIPVGPTPPALAEYLQQLEDRVTAIENALGPLLVFACLKADLPAAADYINRIAYVTDTKILVASDGTVWRRQDSGLPI